MSETCVCRKLRPLDLVRESLNVGHDGRADISLREPGCLSRYLIAILLSCARLCTNVGVETPLKSDLAHAW